MSLRDIGIRRTHPNTLLPGMEKSVTVYSYRPIMPDEFQKAAREQGMVTLVFMVVLTAGGLVVVVPAVIRWMWRDRDPQ